MVYKSKMKSRRGRPSARWRAGFSSRFKTRLARVGYGKGSKSVYSFREPYVGAVTAAPSTGTGGILTGQLSNLTNQAQYAGLFDLYKITGMKVTFIPHWNVAQPSLQDLSSGTAGVYQPGGLPHLYIAPNRDPQVPAPVSLPDIVNDDGVKIRRLDKKCSFFIKYPKPQVIMPDGTTPLPLMFNNNIQPWLSTGGNAQAVSQIDLKHFGFRYWIDNGVCANSIQVTVITTLYFKVKERD